MIVVIMYCCKQHSTPKRVAIPFAKGGSSEKGAVRNKALGVLNIGFHQWTNTSLGTLTQRRSRGGSQPISLSITSFTPQRTY